MSLIKLAASQASINRLMSVVNKSKLLNENKSGIAQRVQSLMGNKDRLIGNLDAHTLNHPTLSEIATRRSMHAIQIPNEVRNRSGKILEHFKHPQTQEAVSALANKRIPGEQLTNLVSAIQRGIAKRD